MIFDSVNDLATMEMIFGILAPIFNEASRHYCELRVKESEASYAETIRHIAESEREIALLKWQRKRKDLIKVHAGLSKPRRGRKHRPKLAIIA